MTTPTEPEMFVIKRGGARQLINISKIRSKIEYFNNYIYTLNKVDLDLVTQQVKVGLHNDISTSDIDVFTARICMELASGEPEYGVLASRILVNNHQKNTLTGFKDKMEKLYRRTDHTGAIIPLIDRTFYKFVCTNQRKIQQMIDYERDYLFDTTGFLTLENQYLSRLDGKVVERPQDIFMREAIALCMNIENFHDPKALEEIHVVYDLLSTQKYTYATPTLNNSGMAVQQLSSCFLLGTGDSLEEINKTLDDAAKISKYGGGIGIHMSNLRSAGQMIRGTNGKSSGVREFVKMFDPTAVAYNQGGKRKGSFAIFLRDYHPDLFDFIQMKNPVGDESARARNLFYAVALSDCFWKAVEEDGPWYFVDPEEYLGLDELYGDKFEEVYYDLVDNGKSKKTMKARVVLKEIMRHQFESGVPYIINFDHMNNKSNLKHYLPVKSSNLCVEIALPSNTTEYGVCNLASVVLPTYVVERKDLTHGDIEMLRKPNYRKFSQRLEDPVFDYLGMAKVVQIITRTMDRVIDRNTYPVKEAMISNLLHRPIGIGTSGFADVCCLLRVPFDSTGGVKLSANIAETIAYSAYSESSKLAKELNKCGTSSADISHQIFSLFENSKNYSILKKQLDKLTRRTDMDMKEYYELQGKLAMHIENPIPLIIPLIKKLGVYPSYYYGSGAPISKGDFQWKLWGLEEKQLSGMWDWDTLGNHIKRFGIRNSLMTAQMPTATTAHMFSCNESVEPFTSNMYRRSILTGEFTVFNRYLLSDLIEMGLWSEELKNILILSGGSIQNIDGIPDDLKLLYKTAWDMGQKVSVDHAVARGPFLDHSQSFNIFIGNSTDLKIRADKLYKTLYYGWKKGMKTGMYYLRSQPATKAQQFSIPLETVRKMKEMKNYDVREEKEEEVGCLLCGT